MPVEVAIVVPVYNEADNILPLAEEVIAAMERQPHRFELVFVDDASTDATWERIGAAVRRFPQVRGWRHARNAGQSAALWTGWHRTSASILATLDGDLQNDPADLPRLLAKLAEVDFVSGMRVDRRDNVLRRFSSAVARWMRRWVLGADFRDTGCAVRVFRRAVLDAVPPIHGLHRFLPILVQAGGFRTLEVPVNHRPRRAGISKYGIWNRLGRGIHDLIGVRWYLKRQLRPVPVSEWPAASGEASASAPAQRNGGAGA